VEQGIVVFDGAMGTSIQRYNLTAQDFGGEQYNGCNDYLVITRPDVIEAIHRSFLEAGCHVVETDTFRGNRLTLDDYGLGERTLELNRAAAQIARRAADDYQAKTGIPRFVAGSIGPSGKLPSSSEPGLSEITFDELADLFYEQAQGLVEGGVDLLLIETSQDILEVKAAIHGIIRYFQDAQVRIPIQAQVTLDTSGRMLMGTEIASAVTTLEALPIDTLGLNCSTGPEHMRQPVRYLVENTTKPISIIPNAGLPLNVDGEAVYPMLPDPMAHDLAEFVEWGVRIVGGCCGTTPDHIRAIIQQIEHKQPKPFLKSRDPQVSSGMRSTLMQQNPGPTLVGERVNSQGSRKIKRLLLDDDYNGILDVAREQVDSGAHILDICVALTERDDEQHQMEKVVKLLSQSVDAPLMIDTTEAAVAEAALALYPGRGIINGNNLENGRERIDQILPICKKHGAAVLSMTIDKDSGGMAKTAEMKLHIAKKIHAIAVQEYEMKPEDLIFDALVFTLATGDPEMANSGVETLNGIKLIKENLPGVMTCLGVSNVSFGLSPAARAVLNSVFFI
jgi:5-methyltetrahydrofolate--homocysteine methyltransferase